MNNEINYPLINLDINNFVKECGNDKETIKRIFKKYKDLYYQKQHNLIGYNKFDEDFSNTITIWGNDIYYISNIKFNKNELLKKLCKILNVKEYKQDTMIKKIEDLKLIKKEEELEKLFPLIYNDYINGNNLYRNFSLIKDFAVYMDSLERKKELETASMEEKYYYKCGLRFSLPKFINEQSKLYTNLINHISDLTTYIDKTNINGIIHYLNRDKTKFYLVNRFLEECFTCNDKNLLKIYLTLIERYIEEVKNKNIEIYNESGEKTTYNDFLTIYRNFTNQDKLLTNWVLLPEGKKEAFRPNNYNITHKNIDLDKYINLNNKKIKLYEKSPYIGKAKGLCLNKGYTAYFYNNGEILLDKIADSIETLKLSYGNAIYNLNTDNFIDLSPKDKTILKEKYNCPTLNHSGAWEERVNKIIESPSNELTIKKSHSLIKQLTKI